jgi:hypothetical protein
MRSASQSFGLEIPVDMDARSKVHAADFLIWKRSHLSAHLTDRRAAAGFGLRGLTGVDSQLQTKMVSNTCR